MPHAPDPAFVLDERLEGDTRFVADLALSRLVLMDDRRWPWAILVPRRDNLAEIDDLLPGERAALVEEAARVARVLRAVSGREKTNVATLGNVVRQFHLHVVARRPADPAWPGPVWGSGAREPYGEGESDTLVSALRGALA